LAALLELDEDGEWFAGKFSQYLVDEKKRELLKLKVSEVDEAYLSMNQDLTLTQSEADVLRMVHDANKPITASDITTQSGPGIIHSLKYRQHASATLNKLVDKGLLGKVPSQSRGTYFAPPRDAVKQILIYLGQVPQEIDLQIISDISGLSPETLTTITKDLY
jgi:hypothetical protein